MIQIWAFVVVAAYLLIGTALGIWVESASSTPVSRETIVAFLTLVFLWPHMLLLAVIEITVGFD